MRVRNKKLFKIVIVLFFFVVVGYTALLTTLNISGTTTIGANSWDVHFENLTLGSDNNITGTQSITSNTSVNFTITLNKPGDKYSFTVDVVNEGSIDAMVNDITKTNLTTDQEKLLDYTVTYSDGLAISQKDKLVKTTGSETIKVTVNYKTDVTAADLPSSAINLTLDVSLNYVQADNTANVVGHTLDDFITLAKSGVSLSSSYVGKEFTVNLGSTYGDYTIRVANVSTPTACSGANFSQTACGVVLEFTDIITKQPMNSTETNVGGWPASEMRTFVNNDIYNSLPTTLKNAIIDTTVVSGHGSTSGETNFTSTDKLYLLSTHEVCTDADGNTSSGIDYYDTAYNNTRQLDYYAGKNITTSSYSGTIKKNGSRAYYWWLRSARSTTIFDFFLVNSSGRWNYGIASTSGGVSPAFRIA